jgi:hypothetical protein
VTDSYNRLQADWVEIPELNPAVSARAASPNKSGQWKEEKKKRMLAWVKNSQQSGFVGEEQE